jgi:hypothetical protein
MCEFTKKEARYPYPSTVYTSGIYPNVRFSILVPTVYGDFPINRHAQEAPENLNTSNIPLDTKDLRYFPYNPRLNHWYERQNREPDYVIDTYPDVRPRETLPVVRRGNWQKRITTIYWHQQVTTETIRHGKICSSEEQQVGRVHKFLVDAAVKSRKRRKLSATWYIKESFNPVLNPYLRTENLHFLLGYWVHTDSKNRFMNL